MTRRPDITSHNPRHFQSWMTACLLLVALGRAPAVRAQGAANATIQVPLHVDFGSLAAMANDSIPSELAADGAWTMVDNDSWGIRYHIWRSALNVQVQANRVSLALNLGYQVAVCKRERKPWPLSGYVCPQVASCGYDQVVSASASASLDLAIGADWALHASRVASSVESSPCQVTIFNIDVTSRIKDAALRYLNSGLDRMSERVAAQTSMRARADEIWTRLATPIDLGAGAWLSPNPAGIALSPLVFTDTSASATVSLTLAPTLEARTAAPPTTATAAPSLGATLSGDGEPGFKISATVTPEFIQSALRTALEGAGLPGAALDQLTVRLSASGIEVQVPFTEPADAQLVATLDARIERGDVVLVLDQVRVTGLPAPLATFVEAGLRKALDAHPQWSRPFRGGLRGLGDRSLRVTLGGGAELVAIVGELAATSLDVDAAAIRIEIAGRLQVGPGAQPGASSAPTVPAEAGAMPFVMPAVQPQLLPGTYTFACGCWGVVLVPFRPNAICASGIELAVPCPGTFCPGGGVAYAGQCR